MNNVMSLDILVCLFTKIMLISTYNMNHQLIVIFISQAGSSASIVKFYLV